MFPREGEAHATRKPWLAYDQRRTVKIKLTSIFVHDQAKALAFYTDVLGFVKKDDVPLGEHRWLTVVSPDEPDGTELVLEPDQHPAVGPFKDALAADGIPFASFAVEDVGREYDRLSAQGVRFTQEPTDLGPVTVAVLDDTCGNLVQIAARARTE
jgi:catechol 2,3-dioxygenase-like lactoylglutathione lyase family enzyme